jgi:serine/threonine-protein kinase
MFAGKYEIERTLGVGGMGIVLAARHAQLGQRVAIKFMLGEMAENPNAVARFVREARAAAALSSEHVARVIDVGTLDTGAPYMVMEYLAGVDLGQVLERDGPMAIEVAAGLVVQACDAIAEAHALGIVHRDLKPANLFLTARMDGAPLVKVLDFGVSKTSSPDPAEDAKLTSTGSVMGSPGYMSPEQVRSTKDVDCRADIWSLGVILYELLTGTAPFVGQTLGDTFAKIVTEDPPPIRDLRPDVPAGLATIISRCLERKLEMRIANVGVLASRLLPFAPKDCAPLVDSILRVLGRSEDTAIGLATAAALPGVETRGSLSTGSRASRPVETGPAWLRSAEKPPTARGRRGVAVFAVAAAVVVSAAVGVYATRGTSGLRGESARGGTVAAALPPAPREADAGPPVAPSDMAALIADPTRLTDALPESRTLQPVAEGHPLAPPPFRLVPTGQPAKQAPTRPAAQQPNAPTPSAKTHEIDLY